MEQNLTGAITFMVATGLETSANFTGSGFTTGEVGGFVAVGQGTAHTFNNIGAVPTLAFIDSQKIFYAQKINRQTVQGIMPTIKTAPFRISDIERIVIRKSNVDQSQIKTVGFDGTSTTKTLSYDCETQYGIKIRPFSNWITKQYGNAGLNFTAEITTPCCDTCDAGCGTADKLDSTALFAKAFVSNGNAYAPNFDPANTHAYQIQNYVGVEMLANNASGDVVTGLAAGDASFVQGSTTVTFNAAQTIATGAYIRVSSGITTAVANTDAVYKVATGVTSGTTIILDTPWQQADATRTLTTNPATSAVTILNNATVTLVGLKFTGKFINKNTGCYCIPNFPYEAEGVDMIISNSLNPSFPCQFDVTTIQNLNDAQGYGSQLIWDEIEAEGYDNMRETYASQWFNYDFYSQLTAGTLYDVAYVYFKLPVDESTSVSPNRGILEIAATTASGLLTMANAGTFGLASPIPTQAASGVLAWQLYNLGVLAGCPITYGISPDVNVVVGF